jgi:hypothetical protein
MEGYMTIKQAAEKWDVTPRRIQFLCSKGRIKGATKFGRDWAIPVDAKKPEDKRITNYGHMLEECTFWPRSKDEL